MLIVPALDLRGGQVVRLQQGDFSRERAYETGALDQARRYAAAGARRLHVVDLDAARGSGDNRDLVARLVAEAGLEVQVAGGVRSDVDAARWFDAGAAAVVMGTVAVREPERLAEVAAAHPGRVLAALDVRGGRPAVSGWLADEALTVAETLARWAEAPIAGVIVTSIDRDGTFTGPHLRLLAEALAATRHPVVYSGGIRSLNDVRAVAETGAHGVILGKSLLEGTVPLAAALSISW
jgi:phosphoribosylformimino-5-aminoimidazole carboxamide ribotide isomerase